MGVGARSPASLPVPFSPVTISQGATLRIVNGLSELTFPGLAGVKDIVGGGRCFFVREKNAEDPIQRK